MQQTIIPERCHCGRVVTMENSGVDSDLCEFHWLLAIIDRAGFNCAECKVEISGARADVSELCEACMAYEFADLPCGHKSQSSAFCYICED